MADFDFFKNFKNPYDIDGEIAKKILNQEQILGDTTKFLDIPKFKEGKDIDNQTDAGEYGLIAIPDDLNLSDNFVPIFNIVVTQKPDLNGNILKADGTTDTALTTDLKLVQKNPYLKVMSVDNITELIDLIQEQEKNGTLEIERIAYIYISSHGYYEVPSFSIGKQLISIDNVEELDPLGAILDQNTTFVITACHTSGGQNPEQSKEFVSKVADTLKKVVIANRSWGYSFTFQSYFNYNLEELKNAKNKQNRPNALQFMGEATMSVYLFKGLVATKVIPTFKVNKEGQPEFLSKADLKVFDIYKKIYANLSPSALIRLFPKQNKK